MQTMHKSVVCVLFNRHDFVPLNADIPSEDVYVLCLVFVLLCKTWTCPMTVEEGWVQS